MTHGICCSSFFWSFFLFVYYINCCLGCWLVLRGGCTWRTSPIFVRLLPNKLITFRSHRLHTAVAHLAQCQSITQTISYTCQPMRIVLLLSVSHFLCDFRWWLDWLDGIAVVIATNTSWITMLTEKSLKQLHLLLLEARLLQARVSRLWAKLSISIHRVRRKHDCIHFLFLWEERCCIVASIYRLFSRMPFLLYTSLLFVLCGSLWSLLICSRPSLACFAATMDSWDHSLQFWIAKNFWIHRQIIRVLINCFQLVLVAVLSKHDRAPLLEITSGSHRGKESLIRAVRHLLQQPHVTALRGLLDVGVMFALQ